MRCDGAVEKIWKEIEGKTKTKYPPWVQARDTKRKK